MLRLGLPPSALVVGSIAPDVPYFVPIPLPGSTTHSALGVLTVDVALGVAVLLLWHRLLREPVVWSMPASARARLGPSQPPSPAGRRATARPAGVPARSLGGWLAGWLAGLLVGATTHVVWDEFTHRGRWGARNIAWLAQQHGLLPGYRWAQYASGVIGALVIAVWLVRWWRGTAPQPVCPAPPATRFHGSRREAVARRTVWPAVVAVALTQAASRRSQVRHRDRART